MHIQKHISVFFFPFDIFTVWHQLQPTTVYLDTDGVHAQKLSIITPQMAKTYYLQALLAIDTLLNILILTFPFFLLMIN